MMNDVLREEMQAVKADGLFRFMREVRERQDARILIDGKSCLNFCSNDYLGLAGDSRLLCAAREAMDKNGLGSGASRLMSGNFEEHAILEREIASFKGTPAALVFSSGYMANAGVIPALVGRGDAVFSDRLNHASIVDGIILSRADMKRYAHNDMAVLSTMLKASAQYRRKLIVTDTVFSMDGDVARLAEIVSLAKEHGAWVMTDEAHAFGVLGPHGAGLAEALGLGHEVDVQMGTLSKAAGAMGAYVAGSRELIDHLVNKARSFIFTTAMPAALAAASRAALGIIREEPFRRVILAKNADRLREGLSGLGLNTLDSATPIIPVFLGESRLAVTYADELLKRGIFVTAVRPPTVPPGGARLRLTVTAAHTGEDIDLCLKALRDVKETVS
jgi:8-amino-7-oxononanoate synthase